MRRSRAFDDELAQQWWPAGARGPRPRFVRILAATALRRPGRSNTSSPACLRAALAADARAETALSCSAPRRSSYSTSPTMPRSTSAVRWCSRETCRALCGPRQCRAAPDRARGQSHLATLDMLALDTPDWLARAGRKLMAKRPRARSPPRIQRAGARPHRKGRCRRLGGTARRQRAAERERCD